MYGSIKARVLIINLLCSLVLLGTVLLYPLFTGVFPPGAATRMEYWASAISVGFITLLGAWNSYLHSKPHVTENISPGVMGLLASATVTYSDVLPPLGIVLCFYLAASGLGMSRARKAPFILLPVLSLTHVVLLFLQANPHAAALYGACGILSVCGVYFGRHVHQNWQGLKGAYRRSLNASKDISEANQRLQEEIRHTEILATTRERNRVGRDIHDSVGYTLTAVLMQINACQDELRQDSDNIAQRLCNIEHIVREAIGEVRREVHSLREATMDAESWRARWLSLCRIFDDTTRVKIEANIEQEFANLQSETGEVVFRVLQEAFTNALRHGEAYMVDVAIGLRGSLLLVRISDNGVGTERIVMGNGLRGIKERVTALGGELVFSSEPGRGFDIGIDLPYKTEVARSF